MPLPAARYVQRIKRLSTRYGLVLTIDDSLYEDTGFPTAAERRRRSKA
jgi:hypothetical protein